MASIVFRRMITAAGALALAWTTSLAVAGPADAQTRLQSQPRQQQQAQGPSQEEILARARQVVAAASVTCEVSSARLIGRTAEGQTYYEADCSTGPGYILIDAQPPQAIDCVLLASQARVERERNPEADVGTQCALPQNMDTVRVLAEYASQAGVTCTVNDGMAVGRSSTGATFYEVGCDGSQGYWLERGADGWVATECLQVISQNSTCRFTTPEEGAASVKALLVGSEGAACDVNQARFIGENANGRFYEAKCAAGNGLIARINDAAVQQIYPCETAQRIGGGCTLTQVAAAPAAAPASNEQN